MRSEQSQPEHDTAGFEGPWYAFPAMRNVGLAAMILALAWVSTLLPSPRWIPLPLYLVAVVIGARCWALEAWEELREDRTIGINALMALATLGALVLGEWIEAGMLVVIYGAAEAVEAYTYTRTRTAIRSLLELAPETARQLRDGKEELIPARELEPGDEIVIRPGERVPTDAEVVRGSTSIDQSAVTGESIPVEKGTGDELFAGTVNTTGAIVARVTADFGHNTLARMIRLVEEAQEVKSRAQRWIDRFGRRYTPAVLLGAIALLIVPPLLGGEFESWAYRAAVLLVAGAPCALVMSTPVATAAAISNGGREGILIKGGVVLEELSRVRVVALDKTGTLTLGQPRVTDIVPVEGARQSDLLSLAAAVERWSEHPIARAIMQRVEDEGVAPPPTAGFKALTGAGARAIVGAEEILVGNRELLEERDISLPQRLTSSIEQLAHDGKTVVLVAKGKQPKGAIALRDEVRPQAKEAVNALHQMGLQVAMLTGDHPRTAYAIARELGIDDVRAGLKPEEKVAAVRQLEERFGPVAMAGDGINDAPALAAATVGIAMGAGGSDAAIEAADVALMSDEPTSLATVLELAKRGERISRQNIVFSIAILVALVPSSVLGFLTIAAAVLTHEVGELIAIANGLRMAR